MCKIYNYLIVVTVASGKNFVISIIFSVLQDNNDDCWTLSDKIAVPEQNYILYRGYKAYISLIYHRRICTSDKYNIYYSFSGR